MIDGRDSVCKTVFEWVERGKVNEKRITGQEKCALWCVCFLPLARGLVEHMHHDVSPALRQYQVKVVACPVPSFWTHRGPIELGLDRWFLNGTFVHK